MAKLTINPSDVIDYKTPLYKEDREAKKVYRLLPETTADQVKYASGQNGEAVKTTLEAGIEAAQGAADTALSTANLAAASAVQANQTADAAEATANTAKSAANAVKAQVDNTSTGLAATKTVADNALAAANEAKSAAVVMQGATSSENGEKGLVPKPIAGNQNKYLRGDGTWQMPPDTNTTYSDMTGATASTNGAAGLVPAPLIGERAKYLRGDGTWQNPPNTTYSAATQSAEGLMSADDKIKLDGIADGATNTPIVTTQSLFPTANSNPGYFAVFNSGWANPGFLTTVQAKALLAPDLSGYATTTAMNTALGNYLNKTGGTLTGELFFRNLQYPLTSLVDVDVNAPPTANRIFTLGQVYATASNRALSHVRSWQRTDLNIASELTAFNITSTGQTVEGIIGVFANRDGTTYGFAPPPLGTAAQGEIATANWTRARISAATGKGTTTFALGDSSVATMSLADNQESCAWSAGMITPDMIKAAYSAIKDIITQRIFAGFYYQIEGSEYFFTYDLYDQQNLVDNALLASSGVDEISLFARNEGWELQEISVSFQEVIAIWKYGVLRKKELMKERLSMKKAIDECASYPELELRLEDWGALELYCDYYSVIENSYSAGNYGQQYMPEFDAALLAAQGRTIDNSEYGTKEAVSGFLTRSSEEDKRVEQAG